MHWTFHNKNWKILASAMTTSFALIEAVPYKIHTILTDNGVHFTTPGNRCSAVAEIKLALQRGELFRAHAFEFACAKADIDHRLTKPKHPWTNGQVERMNRTLKEATVKRFYYETHEHFRQHLTDFVGAYNFARRLKTLKGLTPYEYICSIWTKQPQRFKLNPTHLTLGPNKANRIRREQYLDRIRSTDPEKLIFLDERGVSTQMTRRFARSLKGARVHEATPEGNWKILTILSAMSLRGMIATMTVEAATDTEIFLAYLDEVLCPQLRR